MFAYPPQTSFNRVVPKAKLYAHTTVTRRVKDLFVEQVSEVVWRNKLSPETLNLPARGAFQEIQVFELVLRTPDVDEAVLQTIDRAIPFPIAFQATHDGTVRYAIAPKRPSEADEAKWVVGPRFVTEPRPIASETLLPLPVALDLASLYEQIVRRHIPLAPRDGEALSAHVERYVALRAKQNLARSLEARLAAEKQFNRKVDLNASLRSVRNEIDGLTKA
jgi:hypothetical protein